MIFGRVLALTMTSVLASILSVQTAWSFELSPTAFHGGTLGPSAADAHYVTYDLSHAPFEKLRIELESHLGLKLKHRGEAHITIVTPPEFEVLSKFMKPEDIRRLTRETFFKSAVSQGADVKIESVCIGQGTLRPSRVASPAADPGAAVAEQTWFVVVKFPLAVRARETLAHAAPGSKFHPRDFHPHVTLGFLNRDLHSQDGVVKDLSSCKFHFDQTHHSARH